MQENLEGDGDAHQPEDGVRECGVCVDDPCHGASHAQLLTIQMTK